GEVGDVARRLVNLFRRPGEREAEPLADRVAAHVDERLRHDAADGAERELIAGIAAGHVGDQPGQVLDARPNALLDQRVERRRRLAGSACYRGWGVVGFGGADPRQEAGNDPPELLFRRLADAGGAPRLGGRPYGIDRHLQRFAVEAELVAEVVVHRSDVGVRLMTDVAHRDVAVAAIREQPLGDVAQALARLEVDSRAHLRACAHSVRLNSSVAALIATAANSSRNVRSPVMATNPVFLSSRLLNACTA